MAINVDLKERRSNYCLELFVASLDYSSTVEMPMMEKSGEGWSGYVTGFIPVQGFGRVDGHPWYFRARGDTWKIEIAEDRALSEQSLPIVAFGRGAGWLVQGFWENASYIDEADAWGLIEAAFTGFRSGALEYVEVTKKDR